MIKQQGCYQCQASQVCPRCGGCGQCCGRGDLLLSSNERELLLRFAEIPYFPAGFSTSGIIPTCVDFDPIDDYPTALISLYQKRLISIDTDIPLVGFDYSEYVAFPHHGSLALTGYGQEILDQLECGGA